MRIAYILILFILCSFRLSAAISRIEITKTEPYKNGQSFGEVGPYEKVYGLAYGEVDPLSALNEIIQDIKLAPRNAHGLVEYVSEVIFLRPVNQSKNSGILFLSLPNRGNVFPIDDYFLSRGYMVVWTAWQGDVLPGNNRVTMKVPVATENGKSITGRHRVEFPVKKNTTTLALGFGYFNGDSHHSYETVSLNNADAVLTKREHETDPKIVIPNKEWAFSDCTDTPFPGKPSTTKVSLKGGFEPKYLYELIYTAKDPLVLGLGFAAVRDIASFLKYQTSDNSGNKNPFLTAEGTNPVKASLMQGVSQCGNFVRTFLQLGFNQDENGKMVFDGVNPHIGTRRISLNIRFARPGGGAGQRNDHLYPGNEPPFAWDVTTDPNSGITGGILDRCIATNTCPKIVQTFSSTEYWQLRASQRTTDALGKTDIPVGPNARIYTIAGTQHTPYSIPDPVSGFQTNGNSYAPQWRALIVALEEWVTKGKQPPANCYPRIDDGTLVLPENLKWPAIPGVDYNAMVNKGSVIDFGKDFNMTDASGILREPPVELKGKDYPILVPQVDADGNEIGGIRNVAVQVPLGTYTGWSLCTENYGKGDLNGLNGMFIPFKKTKAERVEANDPRPSLEERYRTHQNYVAQVKKATESLVKQGFLLPEDAAAAVVEAEKSNVLQ